METGILLSSFSLGLLISEAKGHHSYLSVEMDRSETNISIKGQTQERYKYIKRLMTAGLGEGKKTVRELNREDPRGTSLPKVENGFGHVVCPKRPRLNSMSRN